MDPQDSLKPKKIVKVSAETTFSCYDEDGGYELRFVLKDDESVCLMCNLGKGDVFEIESVDRLLSLLTGLKIAFEHWQLEDVICGDFEYKYDVTSLDEDEEDDG